MKVKYAQGLVILVLCSSTLLGQSLEKWGKAVVNVESIDSVSTTDKDGTLSEVRVGRHVGFDRVVIQFSGNFVPKAAVQFADPPFTLGESDEVVVVKGKRFIEVFFEPARGYDWNSGQPTVKESVSVTGSASIVEVRKIYDHEGQVRYVIGLDRERKFRAFSLSDPGRLIIDVKN